MLLEMLPDEREVDFWIRQNKHDEQILIEKKLRVKELKLYCQSCCYRYPRECECSDLLHPHDRSAETCPDFVPKDYYKPRSKAKCLQKRLAIDPDFKIQPEENMMLHPVDLRFCSSEIYWKVMTKAKILNMLEWKG